MLVLGIESTCDETGIAVVRDGREILSNVVASQIDLHDAFGGVVPELACRRHIDALIPVLDKALTEAGVTLQEIDLIAVARGPGLIGALLIGLNAAKTLALALDKPFVGVNHLEAHLYAAMMLHLETLQFPALGVIASGGHTSLIEIAEPHHYRTLGTTVDDAIGEAFDKVAKILGLPYPGGPQIEALAKKGDPKRYPFKPGRVKGRPLDFSFSGLKTNVLYTVKGSSAKNHSPLLIAETDKADVAASFQETAFNDLVAKTRLALAQGSYQSLLFGGGVTNSRRLRALFDAAQLSIPLYWPLHHLSLDNGAMIAGLGYQVFLRRGASDSFDLDCATRIAF